MKKETKLSSLDIATFLDDVSNVKYYSVIGNQVFYKNLPIFIITTEKTHKKEISYVLSLASDFEKFIKSQIKLKNKKSKPRKNKGVKK